jgi:hypothetical protein
MKKIKIYESEIKRAVRRKLMENVLSENHEMRDTYSKSKYRQSPREEEIEGVFGQYGEEIPPSVLRYMRKNPQKIIKRLFEVYGQQMFDYISKHLSTPDMELEVEDEEVVVDEGVIQAKDAAQALELEKGLPKDSDTTITVKEEEDWMQDMSDEIKKDGTEGSFREWCKDKNKSWDGCSTDCWKLAMKTKSPKLHWKVAGAKVFCRARK